MHVSHKVAFNNEHSIFKLSVAAIRHMAKLGHPMAIASLDKRRNAFDDSKLLRHDPILIETIHELGPKASGEAADIWIQEIYTKRYRIKSFSGKEIVKEIKDENDTNCVLIKDEDFLPPAPVVEETSKSEETLVAVPLEDTKGKTYKPSDCYFALTTDPAEKYLVVTPKSFWDKHKFLDDNFGGHSWSVRVPKCLMTELMESTFEVPDNKTDDQIIKQMQKLGFIRNDDLLNVVERPKLTQDPVDIQELEELDLDNLKNGTENKFYDMDGDEFVPTLNTGKSKLSTVKIKSMMTTWLSEEKVIDDVLKTYVWEGREAYSVCKLAVHFDLDPETATAEELREAVKKEWANGSNWTRDAKNMAKEDWVDYINGPSDYRPNEKISFIYDFAGNWNQELVEKVHNDPEIAERCVYRLFTPRHPQLADNFRLEILTTPEDDEVIGWCITVD